MNSKKEYLDKRAHVATKTKVYLEKRAHAATAKCSDSRETKKYGSNPKLEKDKRAMIATTVENNLLVKILDKRAIDAVAVCNSPNIIMTVEKIYFDSRLRL